MITLHFISDESKLLYRYYITKKEKKRNNNDNDNNKNTLKASDTLARLWIGVRVCHSCHLL